MQQLMQLKNIEQAQTFIEEKIKNVYVGIAGSHVKSLNSEGVVGINSTKEVSPADVEAVIESHQKQLRFHSIKLCYM